MLCYKYEEMLPLEKMYVSVIPLYKKTKEQDNLP